MLTEILKDNAEIVDVLVGFGHALRAEGVAVGSQQVVTFCQACARLDPVDQTDVYWAGRSCLITRQIDLTVYDRVFRAYFLGEEAPAGELFRLKSRTDPEAESAVELLPGSDPGEERPEEEQRGLMASAVESLRHKRFDECTPEELEALRRLMARFRLLPPKRRTRRMRAGRSSRYPDLRRTIRQGLRCQGEIVEQCWREGRGRRGKGVV